MSLTKQQFIDSVTHAISAHAKDGFKWSPLEKLFAAEGVRGNGALNNGGGADRSTRARQLATSKSHAGHTGREVAKHSVFVIGVDSLEEYSKDPSHYEELVSKSINQEHPSFLTCLVMKADPNGSVQPCFLMESGGSEPPVPYKVWWPSLRVEKSHSLMNIVTHSQISLASKGENIIYFGPPGTGKSTQVKIKIAGAPNYRTQFHPEYSHADLIGSYRQVVGTVDRSGLMIIGHDGVSIPRPVNYFAFVPGPLADALECAFGLEGSIQKPDHVYLVIEEINRGDCSTIFGEFFQLLDRDENGQSEYGISPKPELLAFFKSNNIDFDIVGDGKLYLPSNLTILATMNTSDQSLYPLDSAFKRRWDWEVCPIDFNELLAYTEVRPYLHDGKENWDWIALISELNKLIVRFRMENKQIGPWVIKPLASGEISYRTFLSKCLFYLWHDVFKDEQLSNLSPFLNDGPSAFSDVRENIMKNGLTAGFKENLLAKVRNSQGKPFLLK